jgi:arylmalonate decarboxylase
MQDAIRVGLVVPWATDTAPSEAAEMYPGVRFIARGVDVKALTPEGYESAWHAIVPAARQLAAERVRAIMVIGTSLTFYRGVAAHERLVATLRDATALPVGTMSSAIVEGLRVAGGKRVCVCTAYADEVNRRLGVFLADSGFEVLALEGFGLTRFGAAGDKSEDEIVALASRTLEKAPGAEAMLVSCGGLRTLHAGKVIEDKLRIPVVSSMPAALWQAVRLAGETGFVAGCGQLLEQSRGLPVADAR